MSKDIESLEDLGLIIESEQVNEKIKLTGTNLVGGSGIHKRVEHDYYATDPQSTRALLDNQSFTGKFLEPSVGEGHIVNVIKEYYGDDIEIDTYDIVDRGIEGTIIQDFLTVETNEKYDSIIANPPYSLAMEFVYKSMDMLNEDGKLAMFLKIQFFESVKRRDMFEKYPPKEVLVFTKRQCPWRNGESLDPNGKPWGSTMCFAWFIWEEGFTGDPIIKWI